jgi:hypothetical protein
MQTLVLMGLIVLHTLDGNEVAINPQQVTSLHSGKPGQSSKLFVQGVNCVVGLTDGKFVSTIENCDQVLKMLEGAK